MRLCLLLLFPLHCSAMFDLMLAGRVEFCADLFAVCV